MKAPNTKALRLTSDEATLLLDAMDGLSAPLLGWEEHDAMRKRLIDLIVWLDAE